MELGVPVAVVFNLVQSFLGAKARHFGFMLRGLQVVEANLKDLGIPFFMLQVSTAQQYCPPYSTERDVCTPPEYVLIRCGGSFCWERGGNW